MHLLLTELQITLSVVSPVRRFDDLCASPPIVLSAMRVVTNSSSYVCCRTDMQEFQLYIEKPEQIWIENESIRC